MKTPPPSSAVPIAVGIVESQGRLLVARRHAAAHLGGAWEFPGGKLRPGETPESALRRELEEETGITFRRAVLLHVEEHPYPEREVSLHFFLCLDPHDLPAAGPGAEGQEICWVTPGELKELEVPAANQGVIRLLAEHYEP